MNNPADRNIFRFYLNNKTKVMYINFYESPLKNWEKEKI